MLRRRLSSFFSLTSRALYAVGLALLAHALLFSFTLRALLGFLLLAYLTKKLIYFLVYPFFPLALDTALGFWPLAYTFFPLTHLTRQLLPAQPVLAQLRVIAAAQAPRAAHPSAARVWAYLLAMDDSMALAQPAGAAIHESDLVSLPQRFDKVLATEKQTKTVAYRLAMASMATNLRGVVPVQSPVRSGKPVMAALTVYEVTARSVIHSHALLKEGR